VRNWLSVLALGLSAGSAFAQSADRPEVKSAVELVDFQLRP
jgi:hypothetical protein